MPDSFCRLNLWEGKALLFPLELETEDRHFPGFLDTICASYYPLDSLSLWKELWFALLEAFSPLALWMQGPNFEHYVRAVPGGSVQCQEYLWMQNCLKISNLLFFFA